MVATLTSLFISFTMTPALAGNWSLLSNWKPPKSIDRFAKLFEETRLWYAQRALPWALDVRDWSSSSRAQCLQRSCLIPLGLIGFEFMPPIDRGEVFVQVTYPTGTPLATVNAEIAAIDEGACQDPRRAIADGARRRARKSTSAASSIKAASDKSTSFCKTNRQRYDRLRGRRDSGRSRSSLRRVRRSSRLLLPGTGGGNAQPIDYLVTSTDDTPEKYAPRILSALRRDAGRDQRQ